MFLCNLILQIALIGQVSRTHLGSICMHKCRPDCLVADMVGATNIFRKVICWMKLYQARSLEDVSSLFAQALDRRFDPVV